MRTQVLAYSVCTLIIALAALPASRAHSEGDAAGSDVACAENTGVTDLPQPLKKWAQIECTPYGQVIAAGDGWVWMQPVIHALVVIPSQSQPEEGPLVHADAYFTKITVTKGEGPDFDRAYQIFHAGFDPKEGKPAGYRVDATTMSGEVRHLYFFDYLTYGWGISCPDGKCDAASRFMIINMNEEPKELPPAI